VILALAVPSILNGTEVNSDWTLNSDFTGSLEIQGAKDGVRSPLIHLQGHRLTVNRGGIQIKPYTSAATIYGGVVTSNDTLLRVLSQGTAPYASGSLYIDSVIADSTHQVGVQFSGGYGILVFEGHQSNTFTGNVEVYGKTNSLYLNKFNGAVAVRSNISIDQGKLIFHQNNQLLNTSSVTLKNNATLSYVSLSSYSISNTFNKLSIENSGIIKFDHKIENSSNYNPNKYYLYLDDLIISDAGLLTIKDWQDGRDFLLVRKTSANLADALTKMAFEGYDRNNIHLRDYNRDYWQISSLPESTTYGAIISTVGLALAAWQRRRKRPPHG